MYIYLFTVAIPVKYANEFRELFEATMYIRQSQHICLSWWLYYDAGQQIIKIIIYNTLI